MFSLCASILLCKISSVLKSTSLKKALKSRQLLRGLKRVRIISHFWKKSFIQRITLRKCEKPLFFSCWVNCFQQKIFCVFFRSYKLSFREDRSIAKLALAFVVHDQPGLFEILFHLTFRPYNDYCIYIDAKTSKEIKRAFENIVNCYQEIFPSTNIILIKDTHQISWGTYSLLDADLTCLQKLIESDRRVQ